jgi:hypothetical protein
MVILLENHIAISPKKQARRDERLPFPGGFVIMGFGKCEADVAFAVKTGSAGLAEGRKQ